MINKVFFSTMWDLYFLWKYEWKEIITPNSFEEIVKSHLSFLYDSKGVMPEIKEPINELFNQIPSKDNDYDSPEKKVFVEKYSRLLS